MIERRKKKILYLSKNDGTDIRIGKECKTLVDAGYEVCFLGWNRNPESPGDKKRDLLPGVKMKIWERAAGYESVSLLWAFLSYIVFVWKEVRAFSPDYIHAVNEDGGMVAWVCSLGKRTKVVTDVFDSLAFRYADSFIVLKYLVYFFSRITWKISYRIIVTDDERGERFQAYKHKLVILPNYPSEPHFSPLDIKKQSLASSEGLTIYFGGTLNSSRGLDLLEYFLEIDPAGTVVCAGWIYDDVARRFISLDRVDYRGVVDASTSLRYASQSNAIFAFYEPVNINNIMASPNKVYDALLVGTPVLINSEAEVSRWVLEKNVGLSSPYGDKKAFLELIDDLREWNFKRLENASRLFRLSSEGYSWSAIENRLTQIYI